MTGLDIPSVELVVNHNVPTIAKEYVHRVGRTARAGRGGLSLTLISPHDIKLLHAIEGLIGKELKEYAISGKNQKLFPFGPPSFTPLGGS